MPSRSDKELIVEKEGRRHLLLLRPIRVIDEENYELRVPDDYDELLSTREDSLEDQVTVVAENCTYFGRKGDFCQNCIILKQAVFKLPRRILKEIVGHLKLHRK